MKTWLGNYGFPQLVAIIGLLFYLLPGIIFIAWGWGKYKCPKCGALDRSTEVGQSPNSPTASTEVGNPPVVTERPCPQCGEQIKRVAKVCKHCRSAVNPIYVDDVEANEQIILIGQFASQGLAVEAIVAELQKRQIPCLAPGHTWTADLIRQMMREFALEQPNPYSVAKP